MDDARIASLDTSAFNKDDVLNVILQRSEIIRDQPRSNRYIKRWTQGDSAPALELIDQLGADTLIKRAAAFIYLEYLELKPIFDKTRPRKVAALSKSRTRALAMRSVRAVRTSSLLEKCW